MTREFVSGDRVGCRHGGIEKKGTFITAREGVAVVKLDSGYNIGVPESECTWQGQAPVQETRVRTVPRDERLPHLSIVSTGGTIASRIDYRTGAVTSQFDADDILRAIPRLGTLARFSGVQLSNILSENMTPAIWRNLARACHDEIRKGAAGVIVTHGTDTMAYSAAAVSFMLDTPAPVVFVGSQRSADRPSSDNVMNALCAASAATSPLAEVAVVMHETTSDERCAIHRGTRVRKLHTSRRDAFASIGIPPLGHVTYPALGVSLSAGAARRGSVELALDDRLDEACRLVYFSPGMPAPDPEEYAGVHGLVVAGTGLGHVSTTWIEPLRELIGAGTAVVMTSQCHHGRVCDRVYDTGRDLLRIGVIEGEDMLPEVALVKLMWVLGRRPDDEKVRTMMQSDLKGEINRRSYHGL